MWQKKKRKGIFTSYSHSFDLYDRKGSINFQLKKAHRPDLKFWKLDNKLSVFSGWKIYEYNKYLLNKTS